MEMLRVSSRHIMTNAAHIHAEEDGESEIKGQIIVATGGNAGGSACEYERKMKY
jgi:hypothetical protein